MNMITNYRIFCRSCVFVVTTKHFCLLTALVADISAWTIQLFLALLISDLYMLLSNWFYQIVNLFFLSSFFVDFYHRSCIFSDNVARQNIRNKSTCSQSSDVAYMMATWSKHTQTKPVLRVMHACNFNYCF